MADAVSTIYLAKGPRYAIVRLTNISDGTGESAVKKVDVSALAVNGATPPTKLSIKEIQWTVQGFTYVELTWDHTTPIVADLLAPGNGYREYGLLGMLNDPGGAGGTGSIMLTTAGAVSGATYDIVLELTLS